ncbi:ribonuclease H-like domain-containing protein [Gongronella butleri]|nr:ribonuclease H-like domain-containing protein [Gongronella butleri]
MAVAVLSHVNQALGLRRVSELKVLASSFGLIVGGTKPVLRDRVFAHCDDFVRSVPAEVFDTLAQQPGKVDVPAIVRQALRGHVLSVDLGYRNLAFTVVDFEGRVHAWRTVDLSMAAPATYHPSEFVPIVQERLITPFLRPLLETREIGMILIEQQRARTGGAPGVFEHTMRVNTVETILWSNLFALAPGTRKRAVPRRIVDNTWESALTEYPQHKKRAGNHLVSDWLANGSVTCANAADKTRFDTAQKKDDLSDCLMQAMAWIQWQTNTLNFLSTLLNKS